ncbi:hypothetical protein RHVG_00047 [Rhodovulum phage RS1]|uniref:hypothetical protein n=1 Tax=Rhodobacter phage RC1 TaxID=754055 RepID=UPI0002C18D2C|nr:hypothetical protein RHWG_00010 [Rhodobacter phage RC1]YP_007676426.1 hypothetical protein RHVG_00047 [Rhodovulum phage RS1]AGH58012.1 hypothetical protein RHVG_00047 [Rhodovulum phage RS1]AGH58031.1 hypothetical protein RHWG_00010 [Rhodobacter phage RC1]
MPINWKSKVLLFGLETTPGTDAAPTGATNAILAKNISLSPMEGNDEARALELPYQGADPSIPTELHMKLSFTVELVGSGAAGTAPSCGPLLRACAMAETIDAGVSVTYNKVSDGHESASIYLWIGNTLYKMLYAKGDANLKIDTQKIPSIEFTFTGLWVKPAETAQATPDLAAQIANAPKLATTASTPTFSIDGTDLVLRSFTWNFANTVATRFLIGGESILITDQADAMSATVEALPLTSFDPFTLAQDQSRVALQLIHGTQAGKIITLDAPALQLQRLSGLENQQNIKEWPLKGMLLPDAGNDQVTLTFT